MLVVFCVRNAVKSREISNANTQIGAGALNINVFKFYEAFIVACTHIYILRY